MSVYFKPCPQCGESFADGKNMVALADFIPGRETIIDIKCMSCGCRKKFRIPGEIPVNAFLVADKWNEFVDKHTGYSKPPEVKE